MPALADASAVLRRVFRRRSRPRGALFKILARLTPLDDFHVVLDVGANVGNSTAQYLQHFPNAKVWAFEPVLETCDALRARFEREPRVEVLQEALGSVQSTASMRVRGTSVMCAIVDRVDPGHKPGHKYEQVSVNTGDAFLAKTGLPTVDFLKIDTEGYDLKVLIGFTAALQRKAIRFLQVEAGMNSTNLRHVPLQHFMEFLEPLGYHIYRVIGQMPEFGGRGILRRADLIFWRGK